jgi:tetratricopeptide (TPR) repeat protein
LPNLSLARGAVRATLFPDFMRTGLNKGVPKLLPLWLAAALGLPRLVATAPVAPPSSPPQPPPPVTSREFFNAGTRNLGQGKLREAETLLETALGSQEQPIQPSALYNLGHVRFAQGKEELKKGPPAGPTAARGRNAAQIAGDAIRNADDALAGSDVNRLVAAYMRGRGARQELKAATQAVKRALQVHGSALNRWQRASGDFKSAFELNPKDEDARRNADAMDTAIARLVDSIRELQEAAGMIGEKKQELDGKMKQMKGRIPEENMPPGAPGDDDEEEEQPMSPEQGQQEGPTRDGNEQKMSLSTEEAAYLLEAFRLDAERRLPMGQDQQGDPRQRSVRTW